MAAIQQIIDDEYVALISAIKRRVQTSQLRAYRAINTELIAMYRAIGKELLSRQKIEQWGAKYLEQVSKDLQSEFSGVKGFSRRNLHYMRRFAAFLPEGEIVQQPAAQLGWSSIMLLLDRNMPLSEANWYAIKAVSEGWSRNTLSLMIKSDLYARQNGALKITNFENTLPSAQSDMAHDMLKDPYCFDFIHMGSSRHERDVEQALVSNIRDFLLQLGQGFAFVGNQYHLKIGESDFYIDCLFYNFKMRCFVVIELKRGKFKAEYTGQLNLYLTGVDRLLKSGEDNPTIGLVLCESKDEIVAQYAVDGMSKPMGISQYELGQALTQHLKLHYDESENLALDPEVLEEV